MCAPSELSLHSDCIISDRHEEIQKKKENILYKYAYENVSLLMCYSLSDIVVFCGWELEQLETVCAGYVSDSFEGWTLGLAWWDQLGIRGDTGVSEWLAGKCQWINSSGWPRVSHCTTSVCLCFWYIVAVCGFSVTFNGTVCVCWCVIKKHFIFTWSVETVSYTEL